MLSSLTEKVTLNVTCLKNYHNHLVNPKMKTYKIPYVGETLPTVSVCIYNKAYTHDTLGKPNLQTIAAKLFVVIAVTHSSNCSK